MRNHGLAFLLGVSLTLLAVPAPPDRAPAAPGSAARVAEDLDESLRKLGPTPSPGDVERLARAAMATPDDTALRFAGTLLTHGGHACARALRPLVESRRAEVRVAALRGIAQLRIRTADDMDVVRAAATDDDPSVRPAALAALGAVGDAADVPALLDALASDDAGTVAAAYSALRDLSGARLRCRAAEWRQWWKDVQQRAPQRLAASLDVLEKHRGGADAADAADFVARNAWLSPRRVETRLAAWMRADDPALRRDGYRLAGELRLGDLADRLASALVWELDDLCLRAGAETARTLGVCIRAAAPAQR